ncbi:MAG TPA: M1 family metallopeptidase [Actinomycetota bacterium]
MTDAEARYRLPRTVTPSRYDLTIEPDLDAATFVGSEDVALVVHEPVTELVLNAKELAVSDARLTGADGREVEVSKLREDAEAERIHVELASEAGPGEWTLHLAFRGELNDKLVGFYRSTYTDDAGATHTIATTHFEATDARRAFPCWDEPDLKAPFGVTLVVREGLAALSNGPEVEREPLDDGRVRVRFADTMPMSTYLVAFVVGRLALTEALDVDGVPTRVACVPGKEHLARFALDAGAFSLRFFADYYGIPYPDAKVDHVGLPDFAQGAMENLGCITYRETLVLADPDAATQEELLDVAETVAHELAHMWFGDLVTMRWWNGIWLNEAFATFMSYLAVDAWRPDWRIWPTFTRIRANALEVDSLASTRPIEYPVLSPDDASGMFDTLTYTKGGAVLRMLEQWLGPERFRDGIRRYLRTHAYANTETHDLWDALEAESGEPVRRIMDAWIFQPGYPAIAATLADGRVRLTQRRFIPSDPSDATTWPVPLIVRQVWEGGEREEAVLVEAEGFEVPLASPDAVLVANARGTSFVRVFYDDELRARLTRSRASLTAAERQDLVDDAWASVTAGQAPVGAFLDLVGGFGDEDELSVWQAILHGLGWCDRFVDGDARERFRDWVRELVRPAFDRLGWEPAPDEPDLVRSLRGQLVRALGILANDPETQAMARELEREARDGGAVDPQIAASAIEVVAASGGADDYERFRASIREASTPQEEHRYLFALPRFRDEALFDRTLGDTLDDAIRPQDAPFVLAGAIVQRDLGPRAWAFVRDRWDELNARFAPTNIIALAAGVRTLTDPATVADVQAFFERHDIPQNHLMLVQFLERQRVAAALRERAEPELAERFGG